MQYTQRPSSFAARRARSEAERAVRGKIGRARFTRRDASFDIRSAQATIGVWLVDRESAEFSPGAWPIRPATLHWRRHDIVVAKALNYEFHIEGDVPYAVLTWVKFHPNKVEFAFGDVMRITVGVGELSLTSKRTNEVRSDWGVQAWAFTFWPGSAPLVSTRGSDGA